ncbi:MAG: HaeIII family restriction endonuclease [Oscillospiraceae bacterium]|nr:HaeIII family restriction endonuclease [Oscillospiraceae bacterium]
MSSRSNDQGRAYEYAWLRALETEISKKRKVCIEENSSFIAAQNAWNNIDHLLQEKHKVSALSAVDTLFEIEPLILENNGDILTLKIQADDAGKSGDVRDLLIIRCGIEWEIGLSLKHNHFAVKHCRLSKSLDFGEKWFGIKCSQDYWDEIKPIFSYLQTEKKKGAKWSDLPSKEKDVYIPLLNAFMNELRRSNTVCDNVPSKMIEHLLGQFDFYKIIGLSRKRITQIQTFNLRGTLNKSSQKEKPAQAIPIANLPTRIVDICLKPGSTNTVELYLDGGWQFSFRIHNASTLVETSLKFDIQIVGVPINIVHIECRWVQ